MKKLSKKEKIRRLAETAVMLALSTILSEFAVVKFPFGGSVTVFSQVPMIVVSYRYGIKWGVLSGMVMGVIQMLFGVGNFAYVSGIAAYLILIFADYIIAFGALGLGGMLRGRLSEPAAEIGLGAVCVTAIRFICHFISGITIWGDYAEGARSVWEYSLTYNSGYMLPELIVTLIGCIALAGIFDLTSPEIKIRKKIKK